MTKYNLNRKSLLLLLCLVLIGALGAFGWQWWHGRKELEATVRQLPKVPVVEVTSKTLFREDQLPGEIEAYQDVLIYPKVRGFIKWIGVDRGSVVKKDQLMVTMYAPEFLAERNEGLARVAGAKASIAAEESKLQDVEADLKKRQANLLADESTYQRVVAASETPGVIADNDVVQWAETVEQDKQDVNTLIKRVNATDHEVSVRKQELEAYTKAFENRADFASYLELRAPFDGYVTERQLHVGSFVGPDGSGAYPPICRVKQLDLLRIIAPVPERDTSGVVAGSEVKFSVSSFPGKRFSGTIARISNSLDKATRTMPVELNYFNPNYQILPGMFCQVYWPTRRHTSSMFVPLSAVVTTPIDTFVCKINKGVVEWVSVTKGQIMNGMVEVFGALHDGDWVAKEASEELQNESKVKPVTAS
ncbi:MAG TPA: efflux RND transporter periplasmic adaptor subunit [Planktothrix sp.]|jgi:RND family efflux transporter MFP subunit